MILTKNTACKVPYTVPGLIPPTALAFQVYGPTGDELAAGSVTPPTAIVVSAKTALIADDEHELTLASIPASWAAGQTLRVSDSYGSNHDCLIFGVKASSKTVRVADLNLFSGDTVSTAWCPEVSLSLPSTCTPENGDGYRIALTGTTNGDPWTDSVWYGVSPLNLRTDLTPRDYLDFFPAADLASIAKRRDWGRLCASASGMLEERLRGRDKWHTLLVPSNGLRRSLACALHSLLAPSTIPAGYSAQPQIYIDQANAGYNQAVTDLLAAAYYDADQSGTVDASEKNAGLGISYKVL